MSDALALAATPAAVAAVEALGAQAARSETVVDGVRVVWHRWGTGTPLVLLHGGSGSWKHWLRNIPALSAAHAVWAPDLPGFGESDTPPQPLEPGGLAELTASAALAALPRDELVDVAGFSLGAGLAPDVARAFGERCRHLLLLGAHFGDARREMPALERPRTFVDPHAALAAYRRNLRALMVADETSVDEVGLYAYILDAQRRRLRPGRLVRPEVMQRTLPVLPLRGTVIAICGAADVTVPDIADQARALAALRPGARFHDVVGAGHWVMYEAAATVDGLLLQALAR